MIQQLLWTEVLLKGSVGLMLALIPGSVARLLGMPASGSGFWPRLVGALLIGIAGALLLQGSFPNVRTIAPAGLIAINLVGAAMLVALLVLKRASQTRRGTILLWLIAGCLALLSLVEISFI